MELDVFYFRLIVDKLKINVSWINAPKTHEGLMELVRHNVEAVLNGNRERIKDKTDVFIAVRESLKRDCSMCSLIETCLGEI